ncbi:MAG: four helix bundle protein [FCB group bacterium]|nr:four helix bundle protein [FCB group bacterium]
MIKSFQDMPIWQESMKIAVKIFEMSEPFPKKEDYGLTSQIRRAALSISANIAEAFGRYHIKDKINFYYFARGSVTETQSHLIYCKKVNYLNSEIVSQLISELEEISKSLNKIIKTLHNQ